MLKIHIRKILVYFFIATIIFSGCNKTLTKSKNINLNKSPSGNENNKVLKNLKPVIFIHGYLGTKNSLKGMIKRLDKSYKNTYKSLVIVVNPTGELNISGNLEKGKINLIQVVFENNKASIEMQAGWIENVLRELSKRQIKKVDIVTHSMGGESTTYYLEHIPSDDLTKVESLVAIGTPFTWNFGGPDEKAVNLDTLIRENLFVKSKNNLPKNLSVFAIAGVVDASTESDGTVPLLGSTFGKYIFDQVKYKEKIVKGQKAEHKLLHENIKIDKLITNFLWK